MKTNSRHKCTDGGVCTRFFLEPTNFSHLFSSIKRRRVKASVFTPQKTTTMYSITRCSARALRTVPRRSILASATRLNSTAAPAAPAASVDPKITKIVEDISKLTLLETASLISELKSQLNIPDISFPSAGAAPAAAPAAAEEEAPAKEEQEEQTIFSIKLESFDAKSKPKIIKEVKGLLGLSLVESKKFVEAAPKILKENVAKEDADKIKAALEALGAKVVLE